MADRQYVGTYQVTAAAPAGRALEAYQAVDPAGTSVVVTLLAPLHRERFFAQMRELSQVRHPNLARVLDWGSEGDLSFVVGEAVEGTDLASLAALGGPPSAAIVAELGAQAAAALAALHDRGIVHGGVTPVTMVRTGDGTLKLTGAGIAVAAGQADISDNDPPENAYFISPEEVLARPVTSSSDVYALGASLYAIAAGCVPFDGPNALVVAQRQTGAAPDAPSSLRPDLPPLLERTILRAMAKQPEQRQSSAQELRHDLERAAAARPPVVPVPAPAADDRPRTPIWPWVIGLVLVAVVLALIWLPGAFEGDGVTVPDVVGMTLDEARQSLDQAGLELGALSPGEVTATAPQGTVLVQTPAAGSEVDEGSAVDLVVAGSATVVVPDVKGLTQADAEAAVIAAGLFVDDVLSVYSNDIPAGSVVDQTPAAGSSVPQGTPVTLSISSGPQTSPSPQTGAVPNVIGMTQADALAALQVGGYGAVITPLSSEKAPAGQVIAQTPQGGVLAEPGTNVTLVVSTGPAASPTP
jgi:serine/threonine-protein kinase